MKRVALAVIILFLTQYALAALPLPAAKNNNPDSLPAATPFSAVCMRHYQHLTGRKLSLLQKLCTVWLHQPVRQKQGKPEDKGMTRLGGFLLGFYLGFVGVGVAFLLSKNKDFRKWALIGVEVIFALGFVFALLMIVALALRE